MAIAADDEPIFLEPLEVGKCFDQYQNPVADLLLFPDYGFGEIEAGHSPLKPLAETE